MSNLRISQLNEQSAINNTDKFALDQAAETVYVEYSDLFNKIQAALSITESQISDLKNYALSNHNHSGVYEPANANIQSHVIATSGNPHNVTKSDVGLDNVPNSDHTAQGYLTAETIESDPTGVTGADQVTNVMSLTTAEYSAIGSPDSSTLYLITDAT